MYYTPPPTNESPEKEMLLDLPKRTMTQIVIAGDDNIC